jgi:pimeloyl-ACP methyl ester carboxylesterase
MDQLALQLGEVVRHFGRAPAVIWGVGAGGNVALRLAAASPELVRGLILVGATARAATMLERGWSVGGLLDAVVHKTAPADKVAARLLPRFYSRTTATMAPEIVARARTWLSQASANMLKYEQTYEARSDISSLLPRVQANVLFFIGRESPFAEQQHEVYSELNVGKTSIIQVDACGDHIQAERPIVLLQPIALFFISLDVHVKSLMRLDLTINNPAALAEGEGDDEADDDESNQ